MLPLLSCYCCVSRNDTKYLRPTLGASVILTIHLWAQPRKPRIGEQRLDAKPRSAHLKAWFHLREIST